MKFHLRRVKALKVATTNRPPREKPMNMKAASWGGINEQPRKKHNRSARATKAVAFMAWLG